MKILIAGLPGSGKTTQAHKLAAELKLDLIRTGDIFREMALPQTDLGRRLKEVLKSGQLVDDILVSEIVKKRVEEDVKKGGFVMDGYPRTLKQISRFDPKFDVVFYLQISEKEIRKRLTKRGRMDDSSKVISQRLVTQEENMFDILFFYKHKENSSFSKRSSTNKCLHTSELGSSKEAEFSSKLENLKKETAGFEPREVYKQHCQVHEINGERPVYKIHDEIRSYLGNG